MLIFSNSDIYFKEDVLLYPLFSLEKKGILISYQTRSVVRLSVCPSVRASRFL